MPDSEEFKSESHTIAMPVQMTAVAIRLMRAAPNLGTRNPASGAMVLTSDIEDNKEAKSVEFVCSWSARADFKG